MGRRCRKSGCRKTARWPWPFCSHHASAKTETPPQRVPRRVKTNPNPYDNSNQTGYFRSFLVDDKKALDDVLNFVVDYSKGLNRDFCLSGCRSISIVEDTQVLNPMLDFIVEEAKDRIAFPLTKTRVSSPAVVVAPRLNSRSNFWSRGPIHRDYSATEFSGVYSFLICIDAVTEENGAVILWPDTKKCPIVPTHPHRYLAKLSHVSHMLVGQKGTVFVWDARLLHQSLPNKSTKPRTTLQWFVNSASNPKLSIIF
jgi:hypothetical protein